MGHQLLDKVQGTLHHAVRLAFRAGWIAAEQHYEARPKVADGHARLEATRLYADSQVGEVRE